MKRFLMWLNAAITVLCVIWIVLGSILTLIVAFIGLFFHERLMNDIIEVIIIGIPVSVIVLLISAFISDEF